MKTVKGLALLGGWLLVACGNDGTGPAPGPTATVTDAVADTFGTPTPGYVQADLTALTVTHAADAVTITLTYARPVPRSTAMDRVLTYVDLDTDQNPATGFTGATDQSRPGSGSTGLGVDYLLAFDSLVSVRVMDGSVVGTEIGKISPTVSGNRVTIRVPLALIGSDDGYLDVAAVVGRMGMGPTDIIPDDGHLSLDLPGSASSPFPATPAVRATPSRPSPEGLWR